MEASTNDFVLCTPTITVMSGQVSLPPTHRSQTCTLDGLCSSKVRPGESAGVLCPAVVLVQEFTDSGWLAYLNCTETHSSWKPSTVEGRLASHVQPLFKYMTTHQSLTSAPPPSVDEWNCWRKVAGRSQFKQCDMLRVPQNHATRVDPSCHQHTPEGEPKGLLRSPCFTCLGRCRQIDCHTPK